MSAYEPVSCAVHSEYERLSLMGTRVRLRWEPADGQSCEACGHIRDMRTRNGEEFLLLATARGAAVEIRLDRIRRVEPAPE